MMREEAIRALEHADGYVGIHYINGVEEAYINPHLREAVKVALAALRGPTREMVERMRGEWIDKPTGRYGQRQAWCKACGKHSGIGGIKSNQHKPFCPNCGAPMTDEAVDMMLERWKEALDENT